MTFTDVTIHRTREPAAPLVRLVLRCRKHQRKRLAEALEPGSTRKKNWAAFIESDAVNFFNQFSISKEPNK